MKVDALINWESLRPLFKGLYKRDFSHGGGQNPFDNVMMFKGQWHSLSDRSLEESLLVRIDFMQFCGLDLSDPVPDETTLCRFRNRLIKAGLLQKLLTRINEQLQAHGLMVKEASAAVLDATLIESASRPLRTITIDKDDSGEEVVYEDGSRPGVQYETRMSADADASWLKKGKTVHLVIGGTWLWMLGMATLWVLILHRLTRARCSILKLLLNPRIFRWDVSMRIKVLPAREPRLPAWEEDQKRYHAQSV